MSLTLFVDLNSKLVRYPILFTPTGSFYSKVQFKTEEEVEQVVVDNFKLLFGDYSLLLPKSKILTSGGKGTVPDGDSSFRTRNF